MPVLVIDDDLAVRMLVRTTLTRAGYVTEEASDGTEALARLSSRSYDVILTDLAMPGVDGMEVIRRVHETQPKTPVIVLTGQDSIRGCVEAMQAGADNFLTKPFDLKELEEVVAAALRARRRIAPEVRAASAQAGRPQAALIGGSPAILAVLETVEKAARTSATVLITGESGSGKEVVARLLHGSSGRSAGPFVVLNCGAIPETLVESELFGHTKGAFTGAHEARIGKFVQADGGTLFLDEVGELPLSSQVKLLRVLQDRKVTPLGDQVARPVDVRVIAATNVDLGRMVETNRFRRDLFYRLDVLPIELPPLRERREDIVPLAHHFLDTANRRLGTAITLSEAALAVFKIYDWPGNVREMENLIERLVIMNRGDQVTFEDLPPRVRASARLEAVAHAATKLEGGSINLAAVMAPIEASLIEQALREAKGNKTRAAEILGLSRTTLIDRLRRLAALRCWQEVDPRSAC